MKDRAAARLVEEGIDLYDDGEHEAAVSAFTRAIAIDPANAQAYQERAMSLLELSRDREALRDFDRALELDPMLPGARAWRARTLSSLGEHRASAEDRLRDLRDRPGGPHAGCGVSPQEWAECAEAFRDAGDPGRAVELLEEYLDRHAPGVTMYARYETSPLRVLARLLAERGDVARARDLAARACASPHRVPADVTLAMHLGIQDD